MAFFSVESSGGHFCRHLDTQNSKSARRSISTSLFLSLSSMPSRVTLRLCPLGYTRMNHIIFNNLLYNVKKRPIQARSHMLCIGW